jgi:hypothetical protein
VPGYTPSRTLASPISGDRSRPGTFADKCFCSRYQDQKSTHVRPLRVIIAERCLPHLGSGRSDEEPARNHDPPPNLNLAKGKALDLFGPVFGALIVVYALTAVALPTFLLLLAPFLAVFAFYGFWLVRYRRVP